MGSNTQKIKLGPDITPYIKIKLEWIKTNLRSEIIKSHKNIDSSLTLTLVIFFLFDTKSIKEQVELHQSKKLSQRKEKHQQNEKATHEMGENV